MIREAKAERLYIAEGYQQLQSTLQSSIALMKTPKLWKSTREGPNRDPGEPTRVCQIPATAHIANHSPLPYRVIYRRGYTYPVAGIFMIPIGD